MLDAARSPLLSFGLLFRVWPEAAAALDERVRRAPLGFRPLQRTKLRKSTHPGFPSPGSFPSRRFSRPQGFSPSEAARACSIPLPLLGFHLQDPPCAGDALAGMLLGILDPPALPRPEGAGCSRRHACPWPRRTSAFARYGRAATKSTSPASEPFGRPSSPPQGQGPHGSPNLIRTVLSPTLPGKPGKPLRPFLVPARRRALEGPNKLWAKSASPRRSWLF